MSDRENLTNLRNYITKRDAPTERGNLFVQRDQLPQRRAGNVVDFFEVEKHLFRGRLFDKTAEQVKANVLTNTLVIRFNGGGMPRTETFSLDPASLKDLKEQVDRSIRKNATLAKGGEAQNVRVLVVRSDSDETGDSQ